MANRRRHSAADLRVVIADSGLPERYKATYQPRIDYDITAD